MVLAERKTLAVEIDEKLVRIALIKAFKHHFVLTPPYLTQLSADENQISMILILESDA